jgi:GNAT superfamily N-acetyltransferase
MEARKLTAQQGKALLTRFYNEWGAEQMLASYRWSTVPGTLFHGERMYAFYALVPDPPEVNDKTATEKAVGWGSFVLNTRDAKDEEASLSVGVFPSAQRQGFRVKILDFLSERAFKLGADRIQQLVYKSNETHYQRTLMESKRPGSVWIHGGDIWFPEPGYGYFVRVKDE